MTPNEGSAAHFGVFLYGLLLVKWRKHRTLRTD